MMVSLLFLSKVVELASFCMHLIFYRHLYLQVKMFSDFLLSLCLAEIVDVRLIFLAECTIP